ncbi:amino acid permease [Jatrophihabitans sp. YIM 134969]
MTAIFRTKSIEQSKRDAAGDTGDVGGESLKKNLSAFDLTVFGVGVVIGTGIFVLTGLQAHENAGPGIVISFVLAAVACGFAALCYAEFAAAVPVAGSAYTFSYATLGEVVAWIIGWDLALELALGAAVVARGWSGYFQTLFGLPDSIAGESAPVDLMAVLIVVLVTVFLFLGTKLSGRLTSILVIIKVAIVLFVIIAGFFFVKASNYTPFIPKSVPSEGESGLKAPLLQVATGITPSHFGLFGVIAAASLVFFAFIGFDVVSTAAEETKKPQRDLPIGIIGTLIICTLLYVGVSFVITGMVNYRDDALATSAPLAEAFKVVGADWAARLVSIGGICGITTVVIVLMLGQARVLFAMSRDRLLPPVISKVHPKFGTPYVTTVITGVVVALLAAFVPLAELSELVNIGTLFAFVVVSIGVIVLRRKQPDLERPFRVPLVPLVPILAVLSCLWLMINLPTDTWIRFAIWMAVGMVIYFTYGVRHARTRASADAESEERASAASSGKSL